MKCLHNLLRVGASVRNGVGGAADLGDGELFKSTLVDPQCLEGLAVHNFGLKHSSPGRPQLLKDVGHEPASICGRRSSPNNHERNRPAAEPLLLADDTDDGPGFFAVRGRVLEWDYNEVLLG